jgi:hypothetical protein
MKKTNILTLITLWVIFFYAGSYAQSGQKYWTIPEKKMPAAPADASDVLGNYLPGITQPDVNAIKNIKPQTAEAYVACYSFKNYFPFGVLGINTMNKHNFKKKLSATIRKNMFDKFRFFFIVVYPGLLILSWDLIHDKDIGRSFYSTFALRISVNSDSYRNSGTRTVDCAFA